jgi:outer membrane protein assembly factor BamB
MYVVDNNGKLYAVDRVSGAVRWTFQADGPVAGSPAVATGGANDIIVFGADILGIVDTGPTPVAIGGRVYAIRDDGTQGTLLWQKDTDSIGKSSPSINNDGTIYNGTVYIGRSGFRLNNADETCPNGVSTCQINDGGGVYAFGPAQPLS